MIGSTIVLVAAVLALPPERTTESRQPSAFRSASSGSSSQPSAGVLQIPDCFIYLLEDVQVPALEAGAIKTLTVTEGAVVKKGQPLAVLDDREPLVRKLKAELERDAALAKASTGCISCPSCRSRSRRLSPSMKGMVNQSRPAASPES